MGDTAGLMTWQSPLDNWTAITTKADLNVAIQFFLYFCGGGFGRIGPGWGFFD